MSQPPPLPLASAYAQPPPLPQANPYALPPPLPAANPYAAPLAPVEMPAGDDVELAGRGVRLGAYVLDTVFVVGSSVVAAIVLPQFADSSGDAALAVFGMIFVAGILAVLGFNLYFLYRDGQTLGKKIVGIRIVRSDGSPCEFWRLIVLRYLPFILLRAIPLIGFVLWLVDALMIFGDERRCLHDLAADTLVVNV